MNPYAFRATHRVAILQSVSSIYAPTVAELNNGVTVTSEFTANGLEISRKTLATASPRWASNLSGSVPGKYEMDVSLTAYRSPQGQQERLWDLASAYRGLAVLVVRRGLSTKAVWAVGQQVEVIRFRWGKRSTNPPSNGTSPVSYTVECFPYEDCDEAWVA